MGKLPEDDEAILESYAASMAVKHDIDFKKAKEVLVSEYVKNAKRATTAGVLNVGKFQENMDRFIEQNAK